MASISTIRFCRSLIGYSEIEYYLGFPTLRGVPMDATRRPAYRRFLGRLRAARREAGITQVEAARRLGKTQSFVSKSESGDRRVDVVELRDFARLYRKRVDYFLR